MTAHFSEGGEALTSFDGGEITAKLKAAQRPIQQYLWTPADMITFTPRILTKAFGDGRALFGLTTINNRPAYWIIRGCSTWAVSDYGAPDNAPDFGDYTDDFLTELKYEFGDASVYERNSRGDWIDSETKRFVPRSYTDFPVVDSETGCSWFRLDWPALEGVALAVHPFNSGYNVLAACGAGESE